MSERQAVALGEPESTDERLPLSVAQRGLWLFSQLQPTSPLYNLSVAWRLWGPLHVGALEQALSALVRRHEALRTAFRTSEDGSPYQLVCEPLPVPLRQVDVGEGSAEHREAEAHRLAEAEAVAPFELGRAPLLRGLLLRFGPEEHLLVLTTHHIVSDGWSVGVLARELSALYSGHALGRPVELEPLPLQYGDFTLWQEELLSGERLEELRAWWAERLKGLEPLELPVDRPRPPVQSFRGGTVPVSLSAELAERLRTLSRQEGGTLFTTLLAAFAVLLGRYSGQEELAIGSATAGRTQEELEPLIGFFTNVLVLRMELGGEPSFRELLRRVRQVSTDALEHQDMPFELLVEQLAHSRDMSRPPLAQALFTWQGTGDAALALHGLRARELPLRKPVARGDLFLSLGEVEGRIQGLLEYSADLFDASTAERLVGHFQVLLEGLAAEPSRPVGRLPLLPEPERRSLLREWGGAAAVHPARACLHELFEAQVERTPEAVAVTCEGQSLTYAELEARANRLAHALRRRGVGPEVLVGLCVERSLDMVVGLLAILKAGGAYLPLDPDYPRERLAFMLEDSRAPVLLTHARHAAALGPRGPQVLCLDADAEQLAAEPATRPPRTGGPECLAYVIYTSGSTGRPKGALVTHHNVVRLFETSQPSYGFGPEDVWSVFHSYAFDFSVWELWGALLYGGRAVVVPYWVSRSPEAFYRLLVDERVTVLNQTPSAFRQLVRAEESLDEALRTGLALRYVIFGGEALDLGDLRPWWERHGDERPRLINMYGITETTVHVSYRPVGLADLERPRSSVVGRPLPDLSVYVLDKHLQPVPTGVAGEMYVGGAGVARGYLGRPELTAERFVPDPFSDESGARLYKTGDKARWLPGGDLEYLGRIDFQVKLRGFRIELGEIEAALEQHPGVREAAVLVREDVPGDKRLVGYVVPTDAGLNLAELRAFLQKRLPEYMVPAAFVPLEALPLTHHGKLDRRALPAPEAGASPQGAHVAPRTPMEQTLADLFAQVLRLERVGVEDDFFALGGHSLLATQLVSRLRPAFGVELPLRTLFEAPTVRALAARLEAMTRMEETPRVPPLERVERTGPLPLSFAQQRVWFFEQLEPGSTLYNLPVMLRLRGVLDAAALERGMTELVRRHEVLRTTFHSESGQPTQVIQPPAPVPLAAVDLGRLPEHEREAEALRLAHQEATRPFELTRGLPLRVLLLKLGEREHVLVVNMHHIASDGWSLGVLVRELAALYEAEAPGRASPLPELPVQYADYALWQRNRMQGEVLERQLGYWKQQLAGVAPLELPTDKPRPSVRSFRGANVPVLLPRPLLERLTALCQREGLTPFMLLLAAWQALLHRYTGQEDIAVGCPIAGRQHAELEGLIGFFVNTLVLRGRVRPEASFRELLAQVKESALSAFAHQDVPFEKLVEELRPERDPGRSPLFQVLFVLQSAPVPELELPGLRLSVQGLENPTTPFDLGLSLREEPEGLRGTLEYCTDLFERSTVERMAGHLRVLLEAVVSTPEARLGTLPLLTEAERQRVLVDFNATGAEYPAETCLHTLVERQAALRPEAIAVEFEGQRLTYAQLDTRANQLAWLLRKHGVGPDVPVALCLERSLELIVSLLAILKAGGAYVPLDASYPEQRLAFMLEDSRPRVLLTTQVLAQKLPGAAHLPCVHVEQVDYASLPTSAPDSGVSSRNLAYVVFTSGSTGRPKGVGVEHRSLQRLLHSPRYAQLGPEETFLLIAPISFDASVLEVWGALAWGARLVVFPPQSPSDLELLSRVVVDSGVTTLHLTAGLFSQVVDWKLESLRGLRQLLTGGDVVSAPHVRKVLEELRIPVTACYGPTEATLFTTCYRMTQVQQVGTAVPIGVPLANTQVYVLDERGQPVAVGVPGELHVGGPGLARGYLGQPGLTAERFIPYPFSTTPGERLYRTGDLARWREDGVLEFLGRADTQVKVRGFRVELSEVEAALLAHPGVREAVAVVREDVAGDKRLVGYVVVNSPPNSLRPPGEGRGEGATDPGLDLAELRAFLQQKLPEYMRPSALVALPALPLTANAKVDRKALPPPGSVHQEREYTAPQGELEERMAALWAPLLGVERIGRDDDFFECGGHSLLAIQLVARLREALDVQLGVREIFEAPTVALQAALLGRRSLAEPPSPLTPASEALVSEEPVLSLAQEQLWFLQQVEPESPAYNIPVAFRLTGPLDAGALAAAWDALCERHESLRTVFPVEEGHPRPRLLSTIALERRECDSPRELERQLHEEVHRPFELARGPLVRAVLFRLAEHQHVLLLVLHHIVADGWSVGVVLSELSALYRASATGNPAELPPRRLRYAEHAAWQRRHLQGAELERLLTYWKDQLGGLASLELPVDKPRPAVLGWRGASLPVRLSPEVTEALSALCRGQGATLFMGLLAAFSALLGRYSGEEDIAVSTPVAGRTRPGTEGLVGPLLNTLILRTRLEGEPTFVELLRRVREVCLRAYEHQEVPLDKLVQALALARDPSRAPFTPVALQLQNLPGSGLELGGPRVESLEVEPDTTQAELMLTLHPEADGGLGGTLTYSTELFEAGTIERLRGHWLRLVESLVHRPHEKVGALPLLGEAERRRLLVEWSGGAPVPTPGACLHELFSAQAARTPEATAVVFEDTALTYAQLERKANQVAWHLRRLGAGPEVLVGLCVERSLDMVVGLLGILKAGAAYVPLDPSYPPERLGVLVEDSRLGLLLTQRRLLPRLPRHDARCVLLEEEALASEPGHAPTSPVTPDHLAYTIFTSGSTGRPKGVLVPHRGVVSHCLAVARAFELDAGDRFLQFFSLSFDGSVEELFPTWLRGAAVVLMPWHAPESLGAFTQLLERQRVTVAEVPTAWWHLWSEALASGEVRLPGALRLVAVAGEAAQPKALAQWNRAVGERVAWCNTYGPTEATVTTTLYGPRGRDREREERMPPLGEPIDNVRVYVLDARLEPVPVGVAGELYIGGAGVTRGYLGRPELTAERFIPSRFGAAGERLYRTGDRVRWLEGGRLEFCGRADAQLKIRGFRIEPGEVEAVLGACPGVRQAVVVDRRDGRGERYLVAYVVAEEPGPTSSSLRALLEQRLPAYMVPSRLVMMGELPLNANGKVDRRALPEPEAVAAGQGYVAPRSALEVALARLWEGVLGVESVGVEDNFFELGGHSLLMMEVLARVEQQQGRAVPLSAMLRHPTVAGLAEHLGGRVEQSRWSPCVLLRRGQGSRPPLFLVHPANGGVLGYARLVRHLGHEQAVYGVQALGLEEGQKPLRNIPDMVSRYLEGIREVRPHGPYVLGGFSAGVPIAFELARRLEEAGEEVALVVDLDGSAPQLVRDEVAPDTSEAELLAVWLEQYREELGESRDSGLRETLGAMSPEQQQAALLAEMKRVNVAPAGSGLATVRALLETSLALASAFAGYIPEGTMRAPVLSLRASGPAEQVDGAGLAERWRGLWREVTRGPIEVEVFQATHVTLLREPALQQVASRLEWHLRALG